MRSSSVFAEIAPSESRTRTFTWNVPALRGTPVIVPVLAASFNPAGSAVALQRKAGAPPRTATFSL